MLFKLLLGCVLEKENIKDTNAKLYNAKVNILHKQGDDSKAVETFYQFESLFSYFY